MKKTLALSALAAFSVSSLIPLAALAQDASVSATTQGSVSVPTTVAPITTSDDATAAIAPGSRPTGVKGMTSEELRAHVQEALPNRNGNRMQAADTMIDARINALSKLSARVGGAKHLTADQKTMVGASISSVLVDMTSLKTKIGTDIGSSTAADKASITKDYRVYALVIPQAAISAASDRELDVVTQMQALGAKLQTRIAADKAKGIDTTAQEAAYADFTAKVLAAQTSANAAASVVAGLKADNGDATVMASNTTALKNGRDDAKSAEASLKGARADVATILKAQHVNASGSASAAGTVGATTTVTAQ